MSIVVRGGAVAVIFGIFAKAFLPESSEIEIKPEISSTQLQGNFVAQNAAMRVSVPQSSELKAAGNAHIADEDDIFAQGEKRQDQQKLTRARYYLSDQSALGRTMVERVRDLNFALKDFCNPEGLKNLNLTEKQMIDVMRSAGFRALNEIQSVPDNGQSTTELQQYQNLSDRNTAMQMAGITGCGKYRMKHSKEYAQQLMPNDLNFHEIGVRQEKIYPKAQEAAIKELEAFDARDRNVGLQDLRRLMGLYEIVVAGFQDDAGGIAKDRGIITSDPGRIHVLYADILDIFQKKIEEQIKPSLSQLSTPRP